MAKKKAATTKKPNMPRKSVSVPKPPPNTTARDRYELENQMNSETRKISEEWAEDLTTTVLGELHVRYKHSRQVVAVDQDIDKFGDNASKLLLQAHGIGDSMLKHYRAVGRYIDQEVFDSIVEYNKDKSSTWSRIEFTQLALIASLADSKKIQRAVNHCMKKKMNQLELKQYLAEERGKAIEGEPGAHNASSQSVKPEQVCKKITTVLNNLLTITAGVENELFLQNAQAAKNPEKTLELVQQAREKLAESRKKLDERERPLAEIERILSHKITAAAAGEEEDEELEDDVDQTVDDEGEEDPEVFADEFSEDDEDVEYDDESIDAMLGGEEDGDDEEYDVYDEDEEYED